MLIANDDGAGVNNNGGNAATGDNNDNSDAACGDVKGNGSGVAVDGNGVVSDGYDMRYWLSW